MTEESYYYLPGPDAKRRAHAFASENHGRPCWGAGLAESFVLRGEDPRFHGAPAGAWCIAVTAGTPPPAGFQPAPEASAAAAVLETMADALSEQSHLLSRLIEGLGSLDVPSFVTE